MSWGLLSCVRRKPAKFEEGMILQAPETLRLGEQCNSQNGGHSIPHMHLSTPDKKAWKPPPAVWHRQSPVATQ